MSGEEGRELLSPGRRHPQTWAGGLPRKVVSDASGELAARIVQTFWRSAVERVIPHSAPAARNLVRGPRGNSPRATGERRTFPHYPRFITSARRSACPFGLLLTGISGCLGT